MSKTDRGRVYRFAKAPKDKLRRPGLRSRRVCVVDLRNSHAYERGELRPCCACGGFHAHYPREWVDQMVVEGKLVWVDDTHAIATIPVHMEWHKVMGETNHGNAKVAAMQLRPGGEMRVPQYVNGGLVSPR